jgi:DME family drug/metabolite transporter
LTTLSITSARASAALLITAGVLAGTGGLAGAVLASAGHLHPVAVAAYRLLIGGVCATVVVVAAGQLRHLRANPGRLMITGGLMAGIQAAYQVAVAQISVSLATLITIGCLPVCVVAATARRTRPDHRTLAAIAGSLVGLTLLCGVPASGVDGWQTVVGVAMALAAGAGFAVLTLVAERPVDGQGAIISAGMLVGGLLLAPCALPYGMAMHLTGEVVAVAAYLGIVATAVVYGAYVLGLRHAGATAAALAIVLEPLTATVLSVAFHGERLTAAGVAGAVLIAGALTLYYLPGGRTFGR